MPTPHHILVVGCGSIGERHLRTFLATGRATVAGCDPNPAVRERIATTYRVPVSDNWLQAIDADATADPALTAVVIATPAPLHLPIAIRALERGYHVLIEKPLALDLADAPALLGAHARSGRFAGVAYVHRFQPAVQQARDFLLAGDFGPVRHATVVTGQNFPTFRPAYREIYYRDRAQGGGAIQDALTHTANLVEWLVGPAERVLCDAGHQVLVGVEVEDTVAVTARHAGALVSYALNQFQAPNVLQLDFHAARGSVRIDIMAQRWGTFALGAADWTWHAAPVADRDSLYIAQAAAFLDACEGRPTVTCSLEEGLRSIRFNLATFRAWQSGQAVTP